MSEKPTRHVSLEQVKLMVDFMGQHTEFAAGQLRSLEARHISKRLWNELTQILNNCRGTRKTAVMWSRFWSDYKNKLKEKVRLINRSKRLGSAADKDARPLTKLEKRAIVILGPTLEKRVSRIAKRDHQDDIVEDKIKPVTTHVKIESVDDTSEMPLRIEVTPQLGSPDRQSEVDASDYEEESGHNAEPLNMSSVYPKWLIEIEQKRAEAELARARAEERRARVAVATTRAATIQAEALRTLAEAASKQADAVARIAATLDQMHTQRSGMLDGL